METKSNIKGICSFYENVWASQNTLMTLAEFVTAIRSNRWKQPVEAYRRMMAEGRKAEAEKIKRGMPGLIVAGVCEGGHSKANFCWFSGYLMIDIDDCNLSVREVLEKLERFPWCRAVWVSISGKGVKIVVRVDATSQEEYEGLAYPIVARYISRVLGVPVDMQCKDLSRTCYASYDPEAFWNVECEVFPWREEAEAFRQEMDASKSPVKTVDSSEGELVSSGLVAAFLDRFLRYFPYVPHHRHQFQLSLGRSARAAGMNELELEQLIRLVVSKFSMPDCDEPEIRRNLTDAYRYTHENAFSESDGSGARGHKGHLVRLSDPLSREEDEEEVRETNREVRMSAPCFPDWIFEHLPALLCRGLEVAKGNRQRDMLLMSMLTNLSACLPKVRMLYDDMPIYPHLFFSTIASSASGKGIMALAAKLPLQIQRMLEEASAQQEKEQEEALFLWEVERQRARKSGRKPDMKLRPKPWNPETLMIPADISRTRLVQLMSTSPLGLLINISEMDTLRVAVHTDYGRFDDLMRACFHHEMFGTSYKSDGKDYKVLEPKLAFCASGTPNQFYKICPSMENGSYSRYLIYMGDQDVAFRSMAPGGERYDKAQVFYRLGEEVLDMYRFLKAHPTDVVFTPDQWDWHQSFFDSSLKGVKMEEAEGPVSVVLRHGLSAARLAMILTVMRKYEARWEYYEMKCSDEDFGLAMAMIEVLLRHSLMFSTSLKKVENCKQGLMRDYFKVRKALEKLKPEFGYRELMEALQTEGFSESGAKRCRRRLLALEIIEQQEDIYRFMNRQWRGVLKNLGSKKGTK
ncbi:MAG: DUF3987 domain-containing protein [Bacteroides sp.]|nr:DUF3987 domain-containing protein [Bacteroides sp.]